MSYEIKTISVPTSRESRDILYNFSGNLIKFIRATGLEDLITEITTRAFSLDEEFMFQAKGAWAEVLLPSGRAYTIKHVGYENYLKKVEGGKIYSANYIEGFYGGPTVDGGKLYNFISDGHYVYSPEERFDDEEEALVRVMFIDRAKSHANIFDGVKELLESRNKVAFNTVRVVWYPDGAGIHSLIISYPGREHRIHRDKKDFCGRIKNFLETLQEGL
jgi:hypothetical protein